MAQKNEEQKNNNNNMATTELETSFKRYDNLEDIYRSMLVMSPHETLIRDENNNNNNDDDVDFYDNNSSYHQNNTNKNVEDINNSWDKLNLEPFPNYVLENNKGGKKNEIAIEIGVDMDMDMNMDVGTIDVNTNTDINDTNTDINDMDMYMQMAMPTRPQAQESIKTELEKCDCPVWAEGIDRFSNWLAKPSLSPSSLMSLTKEILEQLNQKKELFMTAGPINDQAYNNDKNKNDTNTKILTYIRCRNLLLCKLVLSEYQISEFQIGIYLDKNDSCLLDIHELSGEHFTYAHFLHVFKSQLEQQEIIDASTPTPEFSDNYGMSMEINLDSFDEM